MDNCLVTKLKGVVDNNNLLKPGEIVLTFNTSGQGITISNNKGVVLTTENGTFADGTTSKTLTIDQVEYFQFNTAGTVLHISDKYGLVYFNPGDSGTAKEVCVNIDDLKYSPSLAKLQSRLDTGITGNLKTIDNFANLSSVDLRGCPNVTGSINLNLPACSKFFISGNPNITGDIANAIFVRGNAVLTECVVSDTKIAGSINSLLIPLTCTSFNISANKNLEGTLEAFAAAQGRTSGSMWISVIGTQITYNGEAVVSNKTIYWGSSMEGHDPTAEETAQGWCIR
jgi:hypothetical protein